jgi:uncharacterized protein (TIGR03437 family)
MKTRWAYFKYVYGRPRVCGVVTQSLALAFAPALFAGSSAWTVSGVRDTGFNTQNQTLAAISPNGEVYSVGIPFSSPFGACPGPTLTLGDPSATNFSCITKLDASNHPVFAAHISGASVSALRTESLGAIYVAGGANAGFATTPGAYEATLPGPFTPFVCKLSATDGHALFCTFIDVSGASVNGITSSDFTVDASGNTYVAGYCGNDLGHICVEKLNSAGTALEYRSSIPIQANGLPSSLNVAVDARGNLFIAWANTGIVKLDSSGAVVATSHSLGNGLPVALAIDSDGNPQVILVDSPYFQNSRLRRYAADLATVLFETPFVISSLSSAGRPALLPTTIMGVDSAGVTSIVGGADGANLSPVHPTQACSQVPETSDNAFLARFDANGKLLQFTYLGIPANVSPPIVFQSGTASLLYSGATTQPDNWEVLSLGPASSEVALSCIGDGATFTVGPLSPNEIVSLFGAGIGPAQPVIGQPDARGIYPFQLGGTQVTFDGAAAPLVYVSGSQINLVTPGALRGKTTTHVCVTVNNVLNNCLDLPVQPVTPEIFLFSFLQAAALNQDGTINSATNPAPVGSIVSVFATGLGAITALPDGAVTPWPASQYSGVQMQATAYLSESTQETVPVNIIYAGPAPLEIEGLAQINFVIPAINFSGFPGRTVRYAISVPSSDGGMSAALSNSFQIWTK